mmetsp:Transcript_33662/g.106946  ORF Transcript_33662/g.106946 Transcript_33662/m.106946 type:complete len:310 (-) Transcript_33662:57-986(-)
MSQDGQACVTATTQSDVFARVAALGGVRGGGNAGQVADDVSEDAVFARAHVPARDVETAPARGAVRPGRPAIRTDRGLQAAREVPGANSAIARGVFSGVAVYPLGPDAEPALLRAGQAPRERGRGDGRDGQDLTGAPAVRVAGADEAVPLVGSRALARLPADAALQLRAGARLHEVGQDRAARLEPIIGLLAGRYRLADIGVLHAVRKVGAHATLIEDARDKVQEAARGPEARPVPRHFEAFRGVAGQAVVEDVRQYPAAVEHFAAEVHLAATARSHHSPGSRKQEGGAHTGAESHGAWHKEAPQGVQE